MTIQLRHIQVETSNKIYIQGNKYLFLHSTLAVHFPLSILLQVGLLGGTRWIGLRCTPQPLPKQMSLVESLAKRILQRRGHGWHTRTGLLRGTWRPSAALREVAPARAARLLRLLLVDPPCPPAPGRPPWGLPAPFAAAHPSCLASWSAEGCRRTVVQCRWWPSIASRRHLYSDTTYSSRQ
jgi:hypothetical protein